MTICFPALASAARSFLTPFVVRPGAEDQYSLTRSQDQQDLHVPRPSNLSSHALAS